MFSGEDSSGEQLSSEQQFATWALSQAACSTTNTDNVDWAAIAQQWIQMKESCSGNNINDIDKAPVAPPPPKISSKYYEEQGEAPMEVVKDDEGFSQTNDPITYENTSTEWQPSWFTNQAQFYPPNWNTATWQNPTQMPVQTLSPAQQLQIPPVRPLNLLNKEVPPSSKIQENVSSNEMPMNAARRKTLPAWIREGLEKMEKEKLKQLEKNQSTIDGRKSKEEISNPLNLDTFDRKSFLFQDNENVSDNDNRNEETIRDDANTSTFEEQNRPSIEKTKEERIEELLQIVRHSLTGLLSEVTNEEIQTIAQETFKKYKTKATSIKVSNNVLSTLTTKLGLGAYADSDTDNSENDSEAEYNSDRDSCDSEEELKRNIRARKDAFESIVQQIEAKCMEKEEKNEKYGGGSSARTSANNSPSVTGNVSNSNNHYDNDNGETHADKKAMINGKRETEKSSRFSASESFKYKEDVQHTTSSHAGQPQTSFGSKKKMNLATTRRNSTSDDSSSSFDSSRNYEKYHKSKTSSRHVDSKDRKSDKSKNRDPNWDKYKRLNEDREKSKDMSSDRNKDRDRQRNKESGRSRHRDKSISKDRDDERSDRYRERVKEKSSESTRDRSRRDRYKEKSKERERTKDSSKSYYEYESKSKRYKSSRNTSSDSDDYYSSRRKYRHKSHSSSRSRSRTRSYRSRSKT